MRKVLYILGVLTDADIEWMVTAGTRRRLVAGEVLIREGHHVEHLVLIIEGELLVSGEDVGAIATLGVGEIVGEVSLVDSAPASATVIARGPGLALFLDRAILLRKLDQDIGFAARFYRSLAMFLADRLRSSRPGRGTSLADLDKIQPDELDMEILNHMSAAGERFKRMLRMMGDR